MNEGGFSKAWKRLIIGLSLFAAATLVTTVVLFVQRAEFSEQNKNLIDANVALIQENENRIMEIEDQERKFRHLHCQIGAIVASQPLARLVPETQEQFEARVKDYRDYLQGLRGEHCGRDFKIQIGRNEVIKGISEGLKSSTPPVVFVPQPVSPGVIGPTGSTGVPGTEGSSGEPGEPGEPGEDGEDGEDGIVEEIPVPVPVPDDVVPDEIPEVIPDIPTTPEDESTLLTPVCDLLQPTCDVLEGL